LKKSVIISGPPAIGKTTVAKGLGKEFDLKFLGGGDILKELAKDEGFNSGGDDWWDTPEGMKFLKQRSENPEFDRKVDEKLKELFLNGGVVITSYTLPWLVQDGIKIWLAGSHENSAKRMTSRDNMDNEQALEITKKRYDENKKLYKKLYNFDFGENLEVFDKIIDTDELDAEKVLEIAKQTVKELL
jgi:cytidylate kinase